MYRCDSDKEIVLEYLRHGIKILLNWFKINSMKPLFILNINHIKLRDHKK